MHLEITSGGTLSLSHRRPPKRVRDRKENAVFLEECHIQEGEGTYSVHTPLIRTSLKHCVHFEVSSMRCNLEGCIVNHLKKNPSE